MSRKQSAIAASLNLSDHDQGYGEKRPNWFLHSLLQPPSPPTKRQPPTTNRRLIAIPSSEFTPVSHAVNGRSRVIVALSFGMADSEALREGLQVGRFRFGKDRQL